MKQSKKILAIVLAFLMLSTVLVGCKTKDDDEAGSNSVTTSGNNGEVVIEYDENGYEKDTLPDDLDYKGREVHILNWKERAYLDWLDEATPGNIIEEATVKRQQSVESRLGIKIKVNSSVNGTWSARNDFVTVIQGEVDAGVSGIDIVGQYTPVAPIAAMRGLYGDLTDNQYLNLSKPWWPKNVIESCSVGGSAYFITGDATTTTVTTLGQVFVNLTLYESLGGERSDFYQTVKDGKWTMEYLKKMAIDKVGVDLSGTTNPLEKTYGILIDSKGCYDNWFYAGGFVSVEHDSKGLLTLSEDLDGERFKTWYQSCQKLLTDNDDVALGEKIFKEGGQPYQSGSTFTEMFATGKTLVYVDAGFSVVIQQAIRNLTIDFAVAPYPKYDEIQEDYAAITSTYNTFFGIPYNVADFDLSCIVLEALGSESYRSLIPTIYEDSFQARFFDTEENAEMLDIIRASITYDPGRIFYESIGTFNLFRTAGDSTGSLTEVLDKKPLWITNIASVNSTLAP